MNKILKQIIDNKKITIYRHTSPDGDAVFSQLAMYDFLKTNFKNKDVRLCGNEVSDLVKLKRNNVPDSFIKDSLAIVIDTANSPRIDDQRYSTAKYIIKIDHHPNTDPYGDINYVDTDCVAACEVLYKLFTSKDFKKYKITDTCAKCLFRGIITDSLNFKTNNTSRNTFLRVTKILNKRNFDMSKINYDLFAKDKEYFDKVTKLRTYVKYDKKFAYCLLEQKDLDAIGFTALQAKDNIAEFGSLKDINVWAIFTWNKERLGYDGSMRGRNGCIVNKIALKYGGGGHPYAAGVRDLSSKDLKVILKEYSKLANK